MYPPSGPQGPSPAISDLPRVDADDRDDELVPPPLPPRHGKLWVQLTLLAATFVTTTITGACHYASFSIDFAKLSAEGGGQLGVDLFSDPLFYARGLWYSLTILGILGLHEMGHYIACLRYDVEATRPYFLPAPLPLTGPSAARSSTRRPSGSLQRKRT